MNSTIDEISAPQLGGRLIARWSAGKNSIMWVNQAIPDIACGP